MDKLTEPLNTSTTCDRQISTYTYFACHEYKARFRQSPCSVLEQGFLYHHFRTSFATSGKLAFGRIFPYLDLVLKLPLNGHFVTLPKTAALL